MENYISKGTSSMPEIELDCVSGDCLIEGRSIPKDAFVEYSDIKHWFLKYMKEPAKETTLEIKLEYFNTGTSKILFDIFYILEQSNNDDTNVVVNWYYKDGDTDMLDSGKRFEKLLDISFNFIIFN